MCPTTAKYYRRAYVYEPLKIFCITDQDIHLVGTLRLTGQEEDFKMLRRVLLADDYRIATRRAFIICVVEHQSQFEETERDV